MKKIFSKELIIGLCVVIALAILFLGIDFLKGVNVFKAANYYYASYTNVEGLAVSAPVTVNGFKVGQVRSIEYEYDNPGHVKVEMSLDRELKLPEGTEAILGSDLLGTASIQLVLGQGDKYYEVGSTIPAGNASGLLDAVSNELMPSVSEIFPKVDTLLTNINLLVGNPALQASITRLDTITADLQTTVNNLATMTSMLAPIARDVKGATSSIQTIMCNVDSLTADLAHVSGELRDVPVDSLVATLQETVDNLNDLSRQLNDPNSTLGLLMHDPAMYNNINSTIQSLDSLFTDIKANPKRYINIKVF